MSVHVMTRTFCVIKSKRSRRSLSSASYTFIAPVASSVSIQLLRGDATPSRLRGGKTQHVVSEQD